MGHYIITLELYLLVLDGHDLHAFSVPFKNVLFSRAWFKGDLLTCFEESDSEVLSMDNYTTLMYFTGLISNCFLLIGVWLEVLSKTSSTQNKLGDHIVLNTCLPKLSQSHKFEQNGPQGKPTEKPHENSSENPR